MAKIAYVEHPVSKELKTELKTSGFKILDLSFKPEQLEDGDKVVEKPKAKQKAEPKAKPEPKASETNQAQ